jgi:hypothetical protein
MNGKFIAYALLVSFISTASSWSKMLSSPNQQGSNSSSHSGSSWSSHSGSGSGGSRSSGSHK